jgi:uncharacterized protein
VWESLSQWFVTVGDGTLLVMLGLVLLASVGSILISLPGGWIALGVALLYDLAYGFDRIGATWLGVFAGLLVLGELLESLLGTLYVAKKGSSRYGMIGGFVGGIVGAIVGSSALPIVGTILGSIAGAFAGAVAGEYYRNEQLEPSLRVGWHATVGRVLATTAKFALSLTGIGLVLRAAWAS